MTRILAHHIIFQGHDYGMSIAEISDDHIHLTITPYTHETEATEYVCGTVEIVREPIADMISHKIDYTYRFVK